MSVKPFTVIEGVDGSGKTTITRLLAERTGGLVIKTPLPSFDHLRAHFDRTNDRTARFLFYLAAVVQASGVIERERHHLAVFCDRYLPSTLCYHQAMGVDVASIKLEQLGILKPDHTICLTVDEAERRRRLKARGESSTDREIERSALFLSEVDLMLRDGADLVIDTTAIDENGVVKLILDYLGNGAHPMGGP